MKIEDKRTECKELFNDWTSTLLDIMEAWDTAEENAYIEDIDTLNELKQKSIDKHIRNFPFSEIISILKQTK